MQRDYEEGIRGGEPLGISLRPYVNHVALSEILWPSPLNLRVVNLSQSHHNEFSSDMPTMKADKKIIDLNHA